MLRRKRCWNTPEISLRSVGSAVYFSMIDARINAS
jgi:hypothetical protein